MSSAYLVESRSTSTSTVSTTIRVFILAITALQLIDILEWCTWTSSETMERFCDRTIVCFNYNAGGFVSRSFFGMMGSACLGDVLLHCSAFRLIDGILIFCQTSRNGTIVIHKLQYTIICPLPTRSPLHFFLISLYSTVLNSCLWREVRYIYIYIYSICTRCNPCSTCGHPPNVLRNRDAWRMKASETRREPKKALEQLIEFLVSTKANATLMVSVSAHVQWEF